MLALRTATVPLRRLPRIPRLLARPVVLALLWGRRHTLALWARSVAGEVRRTGGTDVHRLGSLLRALLKVTRDARLANAPELRRLSLRDDVIEVDADAHWDRRGVLTTVLGAVEGVNLVRFTDAPASATPTPAGILLDAAS